MKNLHVLLIIFLLSTLGNFNSEIQAQRNFSSKRIGVLSVHVTNMELTKDQAAKVLRNALIELDTFEVIDPYDMAYMLEQDKMEEEPCYSIACLSKTGQSLNADMMMTGTIEKMLGKIIVSLRTIDVKNKRISNRKLIEFIDVENQLKDMIKLTLNGMYNRPSDKVIELSLTNENQFASTLNNPKITKLRLSGPRIGITALTGQNSDIFRSAESVGGFDGRSVMFQFGYQFEISYLNQGPIQALFEIIPMINGIDQGRFIPSISFLNGIRSNVSGWEFAIGPTFFVSTMADGYIDKDGQWTLADIESAKSHDIIRRLDSRGEATFGTGLVFAFGKSFKSGKINFPVNVFSVVNRKSFRLGISMGFNASEK